jgi:type I restriction enzyme R subunit
LKCFSDNGFPLELLAELRRAIEAENSDIYDVLAFVRFAVPMKSRQERANLAKKLYPKSITTQQKNFLDFILNHYVKEDFTDLYLDQLADLIRLQYKNSLSDGIEALG